MMDNSMVKTSTPLFLGKRLTFPLFALLALLAVGTLSLLASGLVRAQEAGPIMYPEKRIDPVATYSASDPEGTAITSWRVTGTDGAAFMIEDGVLSFVKSPNYEMPTDIAGTGPSAAAAVDNMYEITVEATDSTGRTAMKAVMVEVENLDEEGTVTLSARSPGASVDFTATLTDPDATDDDSTSNVTWQWAKSTTKNGAYTDIEGAESAIYTPTDATGKSDVGYYLQATASYTDPQGPDKSAMMKSETKVQGGRQASEAPEFAAVQDPEGANDAAKAIAKREVAENTSAGTAIGAPVTATDADSADVLTYTLSGTDDDDGLFDIDWATGQIMTKSPLNVEDSDLRDSDNSAAGLQLMVTVRATDPAGIPAAVSIDDANADEVTVHITVTDVNEPPEFTDASAGTAHDVNEGLNLISNNVYVATDPDVGDTDDPTWSVTGPDAGKFDIEDGSLTFKTASVPNYEMPADTDMDNVYEVTVVATSAGKAGTRDVKVTVRNVEEDGTVTLSQVQPTEGIPIKASLSDPDGNVSSLTWQWNDGTDDIEGATSDTYMPVAGDIGDTLTATAMYFDGESAPGATAKKSATVESNTVARDSRNKAPVFADQDMDTEGVQNTMATRKVEENTKALAGSENDDAATDANENVGDNVGTALTATDTKANGDPETLTYSLGGADAAKFRVRQNGQIEVAAGTELDFETKSTYMVTVIATDPFNASASIDVTIMVTDLDEVPEITGDESHKHDEKDGTPVATYTASDPEMTAITSWRVTGTDGAAFMIEDGVLSFVKSPNYEMPTDIAGTGPSTAAAVDNMYEITVEATDSTGRTAMKAVMVEVENLDEEGTVTLSARSPGASVDFTATLTDPDATDDDSTSNVTWQWAKSTTKNGAYTDIEGAESAIYTPTDATGKSDVGYYLQATASYTDPQGPDKSAMMKSETKVQGGRQASEAPEFAAVQDPEGANDAAKAIAKREVAENTSAGTAIGAPVTATDADSADVLTYTLSGTDDDDGLFDIDWATGQIMTKSPLNVEDSDLRDSDNSAAGLQLMVTVRATDPAGIPAAVSIDDATADEVTVHITVTDVNEPPEFTDASAGTAHDVNEGLNLISNNVYVATDPDVGDTDDPTWSVTGPDAGKFDIEDGSLTFKTASVPNYEMPADTDMDNVYEVTVVATSAGKAGTRDVKVTVRNVEEDGTVTLSQVQPTEGIPIKASLSDPDGNVSSLTWQWNDGTDDIEGATSDTYMPVAGDIGDTLTATAMYFDGESAPGATAKKSATVESNTVARDSRNKAPVFADQDMDTEGVQNTMATRKVEENTKALAGSENDDAATDANENVGDNVGTALTATDTKANGDPETLTYSLGGADAAKFRVRQNGQIEVAAGTELDFETKSTYMVTVIATDPFNASASIDVTIMVTDLDEAPEIMVGGLSISGLARVDYAEDRRDAVATYAASGPEAASAAWSLEGDDAGDFRISSGGELTFVRAPDYENPADANTDNTYMVTVKADDGTYMNTRDVAVTVTDVDDVVTGDPLVDRFDDNGNGMIDKEEVYKAIDDYLDSVAGISKKDVFDVIDHYLDS